MQSAAARLIVLHERAELTKSHDDILQSIVHMHCNRLVGRASATEELALSLLLRSLEQAPVVLQIDAA
jgi:hypothetical protein